VRGVTDEQIHTMLVDNPATIFGKATATTPSVTA